MGTVYVAEQETPIRRKVALKVIKPGMDTREVIARFEAERQALALMDHPHIAKVLDVGKTESGRPYFVMELIRGIPVTEYCDQRQLNPRERLALFIRVCQGLQHAHSKGIIHRDLKPSNVLVTQHDDVALPKVIDFGVAKAIEQRLSENTIYTRFAQVIGTPLYMSPEQAEMNAVDVDPRSDVYSLGVLLYELLTGTTPFDFETLRNAGFDGMRKIIREEDPPRPSNRLSTLDARKRSTVTLQRGLDQRRLKRLLRGDLDWIVMKALEKDRNRRYRSAGAFAADLQRFLDDRPVEARAPSVTYRLRKFVLRTRRTLSTAAILALCGPLAVFGVYVLLTGTAPQSPQIFSPENSGQLPTTEKTDPSPLSDVPVPTAPSQARILPGLVSDPAYVDKVGHWQLVTRQPRGVMTSAVFSPDERRIALGEANNVRIYDAANMRLLHVLVGHTQPVTSVAWHPGGERLASSSGDGTVRLWSSEGIPTHLLKGHSAAVYKTAWRPDGERLASASADGTVRLWNADATLQRVIEEGDRHVFCIDWSPDGKLLAAGGGDIRSPNQDRATGRSFGVNSTGSVVNLTPPPSAGRTFDTSIRLWDPETGEMIRKFGGSDRYSVLGLHWHPDGNQLAAGHGDIYRSTQEAFEPIPNAGVRIWNTDGTAGPSISGKFGTINAVAWDSDGRRLAFGGRHGILRVWSAEEQDQLVTPTDYALDLNGIHWKRDGSGLLATSRALLREWNSGASSTYLLSGLANQGYLVVKWKPEGETIAAKMHGATSFWSADGTPLPQPAPENNLPAWWEPATSDQRPDGTPGRRPPEAPSRMREWAWSRNGWLAGATWMDASVRIWDDQTKLIAILKGHRGGVESVDWSPAGDWLASGGGDTVRLWRPDGTPGPVMTGHTDEVYPVAWSPDGRWIASAGSDATIRLWKPNGAPGPVLRGHQGGIHDIAWSPDSRRIVSASWLDSTLRVWNIETRSSEWQVLRLEMETPVTLSASGQPWHGNRGLLDLHLFYLIERPDGGMQTMSFSDFRKRFALPFVQLYAERRSAATAKGQWERAEAAFADAVTFQSDVTDPVRNQIGAIGLKLAQALQAAGEPQRAERTLRVCAEVHQSSLDSSNEESK